MSTKELVAHLTELLEPHAEEQGFELVAVEQSGGRGTPVIRVLLDRANGVTLDEVASANFWISQVLDEEDPFQGPYTLEVSSPGVDRPLTKRPDFVRFAGETVSLKVQNGEKRKSWTGVLVGMDADDVLLDVDDARVRVPYETILKARLKGVVDFGKGRGAE